jgi:hypothetical protein
VSRLPWRRSTDGGFAAFPGGGSVPERFARIRPMVNRTGAFSWAVGYDGATISGVADSAQEASDAGRGKLVNALSIELYKFRTGERSE